MDQNENLIPETEPAASSEDAPKAAEAPLGEGAREVGESASTSADEENADDRAESPVPAPPTDWRFGDTDAEKRDVRPQGSGGARSFFAVFGGVVAAAMALLLLVLCLGESGFHILRTVTVEKERIVYVREYDSASGLLTPNEAADQMKKSTVTISVRTATGVGVGSGFIYTENGYICTNHHVVDGATSIQVILPDGEAVDATPVGSDEMADLAVIKIDKTGLVPAQIGSSADLLVGDDVVAVGSPASIDYAGTSTFGKISYTERIVPLTDDQGMVYKRMHLIQTDTSVNPGNSGGPLADMYGRVVGIVVMKVSYFGGTVYDGIGFAIPIDAAKTVIDEIIRDGRFTGENPVATGRAVLGISGRGVMGGYWYSDLGAEDCIQSATEKNGYTYIAHDGVYVMSVSGTNAAGKLYQGDIITKINGLNMYTVYDVIDQVNRYAPGQAVILTVLRPGRGDYYTVTIKIVLAAE